MTGATNLQPAPKQGAPVDLSVIFVTRNEEEHIEECIRTTTASVEQARREGVLKSVEYILADSASTDRTVEIASQFPLQIVRLEDSWPLSCGAGCYVGLHHANGTYAAIINADMAIDQRFFANAMRLFAPDVAGVVGVVKEDFRGKTVVERLTIRYSFMPLSIGTLPAEVANHPGGYSAGTMIVRTEAVRGIGSFNPFFRAAEDMDVRYRLLRAGWKVLDVPVVQGTHYWASEAEPLDFLQYYKTILRNSVGLGQMARFHLRSDPLLSRRAARQAIGARAFINMLPGVGWAILFGCHLLGLTTRNLPILVGCLLFDSLMAARVYAEARSAHVPARDRLYEVGVGPSIFGLVRLAGFVRGITMTPKGAADYPGFEAVA